MLRFRSMGAAALFHGCGRVAALSFFACQSAIFGQSQTNNVVSALVEMSLSPTNLICFTCPAWPAIQPSGLPSKSQTIMELL